MTHAEQVIEQAPATISASRAARERDPERRAIWQRHVEESQPLLPFPRPVQLLLALQ
ncbi:hypothetical protein [Rhizobium rhizogenes]|nr:hypothetical protein [Rhizobium rhizogenes]NTF50339.1 hypothetical protein [Rhizobium rhizogenes]NTG68836.1 hypothetical protein [Rhizobium rhizogenes]NTH07719.1 hypothetical protein [Rhizobium rhizogenes]NTH53015.1 hypothetical protein [Rhizobium rhizogenes]NTH72599.1 hypothetical protein [Rhizobium rhizogenes]